MSLRFSGTSSANCPMIAKRSGYLRAASIATALEFGSQPPAGWSSAASTPASSISFNSSSAVNLSTLRCRPVVGITVCDQMCTCASMIFMTFLPAKFARTFDFHFFDVGHGYYLQRKEYGMPEFRLTQISDTHLARRLPSLTDNFHRVSEYIDAKRPDLVINSGDLAFDGPSSPGDLEYARTLHDA